MASKVRSSHHPHHSGTRGQRSMNKDHHLTTRAKDLKQRRGQLSNRPKPYDYSFGGRNYSFFLLGTLDEEDDPNSDVDFGFHNDDPPLAAVNSSSESSSSNNENDSDGSSGSSSSSNKKGRAWLSTQLMFPSSSGSTTSSLTAPSSYGYYSSAVSAIYENSLINDSDPRKEAIKLAKLQASPMSVLDYPATPSTAASTAYPSPTSSPSSSSPLVSTTASTSMRSPSSFPYGISNVSNSNKISCRRRGSGPVDLDESVASTVEEDEDFGHDGGGRGRDDDVYHLNGQGRYVHPPLGVVASSNSRRRGTGPVDLDESIASTVFEDGSSCGDEDNNEDIDDQLSETASTPRRFSIRVDLDEVQECDRNFDVVWKEHEDEFLLWKDVKRKQCNGAGGGFAGNVDGPTVASAAPSTAVVDETKKVPNPGLGLSPGRHSSHESPRVSNSNIRPETRPLNGRSSKDGTVSPTSITPSDEGRNDAMSVASVDTYGFSVANHSTTKKKWMDLGGEDDEFHDATSYSNEDEKERQTDVASIRSVDTYGYSLAGNSATRKKWSSLGGGDQYDNDEVGSIGRASIDGESYGFSSLPSKDSLLVRGNSKPSLPTTSLKPRPGGPKAVQKIYQDFDLTSESAPGVVKDGSKISSSPLAATSNDSLHREEMGGKPWVPSLDDNNDICVLTRTRTNVSTRSQNRSLQSVDEFQVHTQKISTSTARDLRHSRLRSTGNIYPANNENLPQPGFISMAADAHLTESIGIVGIVQTADESDAVSEITVQTKDRRVRSSAKNIKNDDSRPTGVAVKGKTTQIFSTREVPGHDVTNTPVAFDSSVKTPPQDLIPGNIFYLQEVPPPEQNDENPNGFYDSSVKTPPNLYSDGNSSISDCEFEAPSESSDDGELEGSKYWDDVSSIGLVGAEAIAAAERGQEEDKWVKKTLRITPCRSRSSRVEETHEDVVFERRRQSSNSIRKKNQDIFRRPTSERSKKSTDQVAAAREEIPNLELNPTFSTVWDDDDSDLIISAYDAGYHPSLERESSIDRNKRENRLHLLSCVSMLSGKSRHEKEKSRSRRSDFNRHRSNPGLFSTS
eukprot:CAMPEP_0113483012 /NCGR_PEP_ID=MMETSP0014_2-20120614/23214_1 /TAXON_ID=2857 /ORGANISM="Nitzschia sp." /LENGTH=1075 /DNA_ID=CAMNT_0000376545 /DNA_START=686 /DNA_END=3913 /DNA_ORIENTATION=- /assembly_acc=CAM_ASM_000159